MASNISSYDPINQGSEATPGLWDRRYQQLHKNDASLRSSAVDTSASAISLAGRLYVNSRANFNSNVSVGSNLQVNGSVVNVGTSAKPASGTAAGSLGDISWTTRHIYVCTSANSWQRATLAAF